MAEAADELKAAAEAAFAAPFGAVLKIDCGDAVLFVDGRGAAPTVSGDAMEADCAWLTSAACFRQLMAGRLQPAKAFLTGQLKVAGDMSVLARLQLSPDGGG